MAKLIFNHESWVWEVVSNNEPTVLMAVVTTSVLILAALWYKLTHSSSSPPLPPGPRELPIVGYLPFLGRDLHKQFTTMAHTYGPIFKFHMGSRRYIVINNLEIATEVLRDQDNNFTCRIPTLAASIITDGGKDISFSSNSNWHDQRKLLVSEVLCNKNLEACSPFRRYQVRKAIKNVYSKIGTAVNFSEICFSTAVIVLCSMLWENSSDNVTLKDRNLDAELYIMASEIIQLLLRPNVSDFFPCLAWLDLQGVQRDMKKHFEKLDQLYTNIFEDRIKSNSKKIDDGFAFEGKKDFLQILFELKDQKKLSFDQIKALFTVIN